MKSYRADWTREEAEAELAKQLLKIEPAKTKGTGITLKGAVERYLVAKARKLTLAEDKRQLEALKTEFGPDTPVGDITANRISQYKDKRLSLVRTIGEGANAVERRLTNAAVNRPLALLRHLLRIAHEEWEVIDNVPRIRLEKEPQGRLRWLKEKEITQLLEACAESKNKEVRAAVIIAVTPRMTAQDANVWRRVWKFTSSSLAASTALL